MDLQDSSEECSQPSLTWPLPFALYEMPGHSLLPPGFLEGGGGTEAMPRSEIKTSMHVPAVCLLPYPWAKLASEPRFLGSGCPLGTSHAQRMLLGRSEGVSRFREAERLPHIAAFSGGEEGQAQAGRSESWGGQGRLVSLSGHGWRKRETEPSLLDWAAAQEGLFLSSHLPPCSPAHCC